MKTININEVNNKEELKEKLEDVVTVHILNKFTSKLGKDKGLKIAEKMLNSSHFVNEIGNIASDLSSDLETMAEDLIEEYERSK